MSTIEFMLMLLEAGDEHGEELRRGGYLIPPATTLARDLGYQAGGKVRGTGATEPAVGDWRHLAEVLGREATEEEERAFAGGWGQGAKVSS